MDATMGQWCKGLTDGWSVYNQSLPVSHWGTSILNISNVDITINKMGAGHSSVVECLLKVWWVVWSIPPGGPIELLLIPASAPQLV